MDSKTIDEIFDADDRVSRTQVELPRLTILGRDFRGCPRGSDYRTQHGIQYENVYLRRCCWCDFTYRRDHLHGYDICKQEEEKGGKLWWKYNLRAGFSNE